MSGLTEILFTVADVDGSGGVTVPLPDENVTVKLFVYATPCDFPFSIVANRRT